MPTAAIAALIAATVPVIVVTAEASTPRLVRATTVVKSAADAVASVTVTVTALFEFAFVSVFKVARSPSDTVAVITPVVSLSTILIMLTLAVPETAAA